MTHSTATLCVWTHSLKQIGESKAINKVWLLREDLYIKQRLETLNFSQQQKKEKGVWTLLVQQSTIVSTWWYAKSATQKRISQSQNSRHSIKKTIASISPYIWHFKPLTPN